MKEETGNSSKYLEEIPIPVTETYQFHSTHKNTHTHSKLNKNPTSS